MYAANYQHQSPPANAGHQFPQGTSGNPYGGYPSAPTGSSSGGHPNNQQQPGVRTKMPSQNHALQPSQGGHPFSQPAPVGSGFAPVTNSALSVGSGSYHQQSVPVQPAQTNRPYSQGSHIQGNNGFARGGDVPTTSSVASWGSGQYQQQQPPWKSNPPPALGNDFRRSPSNHSTTSNRSGASRNGRATSILNGVSIAPPPKRPMNLPPQEGGASTRNLPNFDLIKHSGQCLGRLSVKSMLTKKWRQIFWISYKDHQIVFFRSKGDFEEWVSNPYLTPEARDELVKLHIDFKNHKNIENVMGYKVSPTSCKTYSGVSGFIYQFKVDKWYSYGPSVSAAIGSKTESEVSALRRIMFAMMELYPQNVNDDGAHTLACGYPSPESSRYSPRSIEATHTQTPGREEYRAYDNHKQQDNSSVDLLGIDVVPSSSNYNSQQQQQTSVVLHAGNSNPYQYDLSGGNAQSTRPSTSPAVGRYATQPPVQQYQNQQQPYQYDLGATSRPVSPGNFQQPQVQQQPYQYDLGAAVPGNSGYGNNQNQQRPSSASSQRKKWGLFGKQKQQYGVPQQHANIHQGNTPSGMHSSYYPGPTQVNY
jgi:hypothetical protein